MPSPDHLQHPLSRRGFLAAGTVAAGAALGLVSGPAQAATWPRTDSSGAAAWPVSSVTGVITACL
ncbi:twin-arginine translocation signal domain-containing protein, partial [Streptomyces prunicolor]|uniref:twin-arginine translocation signal domain-containing protein n=1 Tax=Streptomyces prunicolor TaxID=67348 RepID=UPI0033D54823